MEFTPIKITLKNPVMHGAEEIRELVFGREMVAGDLRGVSVGGLTHDDICAIASHITGVPTPVIKTLKMPDYLRVAETVGDFFGDSLPTGGKE